MTEVDKDKLETALATLREDGAHHFDPLGFQFLTALARRARERESRVATLIQSRVRSALHAFQGRFDRARKDAHATASEIATLSPGSAASAQALLQQSRLRELERMASRLRRTAARPDISALTERLDRQDETSGQRPECEHFDDVLREQELKILGSFARADTPLAPPGRPRELRSARRFRKVMEDIDAEKRVKQAVSEPLLEESGPLNPQKLVTESLTLMRDLSPAYMNRFITTVDTLLWLEEAGDRCDPATTHRRRRR